MRFIFVIFCFFCLSCNINFEKSAKKAINHSQYDKALELINKAIDNDPDNFKLYNIRGVVYYYKKEYAKSIVDYNYLIDNHWKDSMIYYNRGLAKLDFNDYSGALTDLKKSMTECKFGGNYVALAALYYRTEDNYNAIKYYDTAIVVNSCDKCAPKYTLYWTRGYCKFRVGDYDEAIKDYNRTIELFPRLVEAYYNMAFAYLGKQDTLSACNYIHKGERIRFKAITPNYYVIKSKIDNLHICK